MQARTRKLRSPLKWHGGKSYLARRIIALMPGHCVYVDHTLGGGSVPLNKPPAERTVVIDINPELVHFWRTVQAEPDELVRRVRATQYRREVFTRAKAAGDGGSDVDRALRFLIVNRMSRGGHGRDWAWSDRFRGGMFGELNAWRTFGLDVLPAVAEWIQSWEILLGDARELAGGFDGPDTLHEVDPPYLIETRTALDTYSHELTHRGGGVDRVESDRAEHRRWLAALEALEGAVMLHGYRSHLYDRELRGWRRKEFDMPNHSGQGKVKARRVECLWIKAPRGL
jgi:DNA adenine methylase